MATVLLRLFALAALVTAEAQAACSTPFYPVKEGLSRTYQTTVNGQTHRYTETISHVTPTSFKMTNSLMPGAASTAKCIPSGIMAVTQAATPDMKVTDVRGVTYPAKLALGTAWSSSVTLKGQGVQSILSTKSVVVGREKVVVKAGTFDTFKIKTTSTITMQASGRTMNQPPLDSFMWMAEGVGMVKGSSGGIRMELLKFSK